MPDISILYTNEFQKITTNICRNSSLKNDLHSESVILFLEKKYDIDTITDLKKFFATIVWLTWRSYKFRKKYISECIPYNEVNNLEDIQEEVIIDTDGVELFLSSPITNDIEFYEHNLILQYLKFGNARKLSKATGIPYQTITNDIRAIKRKIKNISIEETFN